MAKGKIQINEASREELAELPGIGAATAETLIKLREERGGFKSASDLEAVPGIGAQTLESIRPHITFSKGGPSAAKKGAETATKASERGAKALAANGEAAADEVVQVTQAQTEAAAEAVTAETEAAAEAARKAEAEVVRHSLDTGVGEALQVASEAAEAQQDLMGPARQVQEAWLGVMQEQMAANVQVARRLVECRTPQELACLQVEYVRGSMERFLQSARVVMPAAQAAGMWWSPERWQHLVRR